MPSPTAAALRLDAPADVSETYNESVQLGPGRPAPPLPVRRLSRIALGGAACAGLLWVGGWLAERAVFGADDAAARAQIESEVRTAFALMADQLVGMASRVADAGLIDAAVGNVSAADRLFTRVEDVVLAEAAAVDEPDLALTVYSRTGTPLAWAGRPSELPEDRLQGEESWLFTQDAVGLRLVLVKPIGDQTARVGVIAVERPVASTTDAVQLGFRDTVHDRYRFPTRLARVAMQLPFEGAPPADAGSFAVASPSGDPLLTATVAADEIRANRARWRQRAAAVATAALAGMILLLAGPLIEWRGRAPCASYLAATATAVLAIVLARVILLGTSPASWADATVLADSTFVPRILVPLFESPLDFLLTSVTGGALAGLALSSVLSWRVPRRRGGLGPNGRPIPFLTIQLVAGGVLAVLLLTYHEFLRDTVTRSADDLLRFSLHRWSTSRIALQVGLILTHATVVALGVVVVRTACAHWRLEHRSWRLRAIAGACGAIPLLFVQTARGVPIPQQLPLLAAMTSILALAHAAPRLHARYRHGSQAFRLVLLTLGLVVPTFAFYPTVVDLARRATHRFVETTYAPQALSQRQTLRRLLDESLDQIDRFPELSELVGASDGSATEASTNRAFQVWQATSFATYPATSSVEIYGPDGSLVSRFAFNLPEDLMTTPLSEERSCSWEVYEEVAPLFAEERRVLHAGRAICGRDPRAPPAGSIVVHAIPEYENLPFIASRSPYVELLRATDPLRGEARLGREVEYAVYGWSRTPLYSSADTAWPLPDDVFARVEASRNRVWARLTRGTASYDVLLLNDRGGIYALGFPVVSALGHLVNLAEIIVLAVGTYLLLLGLHAVFGWLTGRRPTAPAILREIRASFYRKLFLAFVAAVSIPVAALAVVTRNYVADEVRANIEREAVRTASAAARVVEDLVAPRAAALGAGLDDNLLVLASRLIDQDINVFAADRLAATSERNLFASGLLPQRIPAEVYHTLTLRREAATVVRERIGALEYLVAATSLAAQPQQLIDGILTVPLPSRQQEIEDEIDALDRRMLLAALLFILGGAGLGYSMAERISDPVNRLSRATRRIAHGQLDVNIAMTASDELGRLVEDFNSMARELLRQQAALERTHKVEAWAEVARQVAHEIKNPLTPIQLNAEHLRRVHADRGEPLGPIVQECVATILAQVRLLRRIASEFSSFASSPIARPAPVELSDLLRETLEPYRAGLGNRVQVDLRLPASLPLVHVDRTLILRSLTNIVENALHAMPGTGTLSVVVRAEGDHVRVRIADTGAGMDADALARSFEPYFSTKASGTGLGLPIAKRNVELCGGAIAIASEPNRGTTVELTLPVSPSQSPE
jgi:signal transduction histidine kinase